MSKYLIIVAAIACCSFPISAYLHTSSMRLDAFKPNGESGVAESGLFGFSLAYYAKKKSILISAPTADLIGKLFECSIGESSNCEEWSLVEDDKTKTVRTGSYKDKESKKKKVTPMNVNSWFGATVSAGSSYFVACAPRLLDKYPYRSTVDYGTFGYCYVSDDESNKRMKKLDNRNFNDTMFNANNNLAHALTTFGWSSAIGKDPMGLIVGGPATHKAGALVYESRKGLITNKSEKKNNNPIPIYNDYHFNNAMQNLGYSVAIGNFFSNNEYVYAIGSPYGEKGVGKVVFFKKAEGAIYKEKDFNNKYFVPIPYDVSDPERNAGSMFAAALCPAHLDGNSRLDLIVGAPAFTGSTPSMYEVGAVHVFYSMDLSSTGSKPVTIKGTHPRGRFGMAIANMGDIDDDNFDDIVIAAPYESDGQGAIYLYSGSTFRSGSPAHKQKITPEGNGAALFHNFGYSLAPLLGYDSDENSGLAVGGLGVRHVAFMHVIPSFQVDIETYDDHLQAQKDEYMTDFKIKACLKLKFPSKPTRITASIQMKVRVVHEHATLAEYTNETERYFLRKYDVQKPDPGPCENITVNTPPSGNYVTDPIKFIISVEQVDDPRHNTNVNGSEGILLDRPSNVYTKDEYAKNNCEDPLNCKPDLTLKLRVDMSEPYVVGSSSSEAVTVTVTNNNETAYKWCIKMRATGASLTHSGACNDDEGWLTCRPTKVLRKGETWVNDEVRLKTESLNSEVKGVTITANVYGNCSTKPDPSSSVYTDTFTRTLEHDVDNVNLQGVNEAGLGSIKINVTELLDKNGRLFRHTYTVINNGKTIWNSLPFEVELKKTDYLMYSDIKIYNSTGRRSCVTGLADKSEMDHFIVTCNLGMLAPGKKADIYVPIRVAAGKNGISEKSLKLESSVTLKIGNGEKYKRVSTLLKLVKTKLDPWIIPVACLFGLLILVLIAFVLYKFGFLKRKKKQQLLVRKETLRKSLRLSSLGDNPRSSVISRISGSDKPRSSVISRRNSKNEQAFQNAVADASWTFDGQGHYTRFNPVDDQSSTSHNHTSGHHDSACSSHEADVEVHV